MTELNMPPGADAAPVAAANHGVTFREAFWVWLRVAALSFGGPAGQIAVMHKIIVEAPTSQPAPNSRPQRNCFVRRSSR